MRNEVLHKARGDVLLPTFPETAAQELLRCLALQMATGTPSPILCGPDGTSSEVMLEVEVDGVRYLLLRSWPKSSPAPMGLSRREAEIARLVAAGYPNKIIADVLDISPWTVCTYLRRIFAKIGVSCRAAMVARLLAEGVIHSDSRSLTEKVPS